MSVRTVDYSALTEPVSPTGVKAFRTAMRARPEYSTTSPVVAAIIVVVMLFALGTFVLSILTIFIALVATSSSDIGVIILGFVIAALMVAGIVVIAIVGIRSVLGGGRWERWMRLDRFASANGLIFAPHSAAPSYPGAIFQLGSSRFAIDHLRSASDRFLDYGNFRYTTGSGKNRSTHTWGFMALQLDRALPQMVLDSKTNNGLFGSNLPATFRKDQILHLEGDFDKYFTLYCPNQYERDALYVFTPDLMVLLIDNAAPFDVEIVDKWMFVYSSAAFDLRQPAVHQRLLRIVDTVGRKALSQSDRYRDDRVDDFAANVIAPQGQGLKRGIPAVGIILLVILGVTWLWPALGGIVSVLVGN
ncbi:MAG: hypothetical protein KF761_00445 [Salinibacterium sp.]|nr:hypothetical protein [Salinibacterium sp.]